MLNIQPVQDPADCLVEFLLNVPRVADRVGLLFGSARSIQNCIHPAYHRVDQFELKAALFIELVRHAGDHPAMQVERFTQFGVGKGSGGRTKGRHQDIRVMRSEIGFRGSVL